MAQIEQVFYWRARCGWCGWVSSERLLKSEAQDAAERHECELSRPIAELATESYRNNER